MDERGQFTFYASIYASASRIRNKAARADFYDAICNYALNGVEPDINRLSDAAAVGFISAKPNLDASRKKAKNGRAGGKSKQPSSKPQANDKQSEANTKQTASEKEKEVEREKEDEKEIENECYLSPLTPLSTADTPSAPSGGAPKNGTPSPPPSDSKPKETSGAAFTAFWEAYPKKIGREKAWNAWKSLNLSAQAAKDILLSLEVWKQCGQWTDAGGRYIPKAETFLLDRYWETTPPPEKASPLNGSSGGNPFLEMAGDSYE